jgi:hypothetical protein
MRLTRSGTKNVLNGDNENMYADNPTKIKITYLEPRYVSTQAYVLKLRSVSDGDRIQKGRLMR